jgi:hypothetical protein
LERVLPRDVFVPEVLSYAVGSIGEGAGTALAAGIIILVTLLFLRVNIHLLLRSK